MNGFVATNIQINRQIRKINTICFLNLFKTLDRNKILTHRNYLILKKLHYLCNN